MPTEDDVVHGRLDIRMSASDGLAIGCDIFNDFFMKALVLPPTSHGKEVVQ